VRDIDTGKKRKFLYALPLPQGQGFFPFSIPPTEMNDQIKARVPSPSGEKLMILREEAIEKSGKLETRQVFEIWINECLVNRVVLPKTLHGNVINQPDGIGSLSWNSDETALVYCAERNQPDTVSYFETDEKSREEKEVGAEYILGFGRAETWGEKYTKMSPLTDLYLLHIQTGKIAKIENVPSSGDETMMGGYLLGQPSFSPCGSHLVYTAWDAGGGGEMPRRLGMIYCFNRPSQIYISPIKKLLSQMTQPPDFRAPIIMPTKDGPCTCITNNIRLARSPRFSRPKDGTSKLCFLSSETGFDTHNGAMSMHSMDWDVKSEKPAGDKLRILVESSLDPAPVQEEDAVHVANLCFPGLYIQELPLQCCTQDHIYTTTQWGSIQKVIRINLDDGAVSLVNVDIIRGSGQSTESIASQQLLCIDLDGGAVICESAPNRPGVIGYVSSKSLCRPNVSHKVEATLVSEMGPISASSFAPTRERDVLRMLNFDYEVFLMTMPPPRIEDGDETPVQWIFLKPPQRGGEPPPLIVVPHGGPHSCTPTTYIPAYAFLCSKGYAVLHVNYRGSTGFGQRALEALPGNIGNLDVRDLLHAVETVTGSGWADKDRVGICGGSHGGFLASHCIGQFPEIFKVAAMRNPVTNIATMTTATDIADWCYVETLGCGYYNREFSMALC
jgi:acylaminoacyl-peptidase